MMPYGPSSGMQPRFQTPYGGGGARGGGVGGLIGPRAPAAPARTPVGSYGNTVMDAARAPLAYEPNTAAVALSAFGDLVSGAKQRKLAIKAQDKAEFESLASQIKQGMGGLIDWEYYVKLARKVNPGWAWDGPSVDEGIKATQEGQAPADLTDLPKDAPGHLMSTRSAGFPGEARHSQMVGLVPRVAGPGQQQQQGPPPQGPQQSRKGPLGGVLSGMKNIGRFLADPFTSPYGPKSRAPDPGSEAYKAYEQSDAYQGLKKQWEAGKKTSAMMDEHLQTDITLGLRASKNKLEVVNLTAEWLKEGDPRVLKKLQNMGAVQEVTGDDLMFAALEAGHSIDQARKARYAFINLSVDESGEARQLAADKFSLEDQESVFAEGIAIQEQYPHSIDPMLAFDLAIARRQSKLPGEKGKRAAVRAEILENELGVSDASVQLWAKNRELNQKDQQIKQQDRYLNIQFGVMQTGNLREQNAIQLGQMKIDQEIRMALHKQFGDRYATARKMLSDPNIKGDDRELYVIEAADMMRNLNTFQIVNNYTREVTNPAGERVSLDLSSFISGGSNMNAYWTKSLFGNPINAYLAYDPVYYNDRMQNSTYARTVAMAGANFSWKALEAFHREGTAMVADSPMQEQARRMAAGQPTGYIPEDSEFEDPPVMLPWSKDPSPEDQKALGQLLRRQVPTGAPRRPYTGAPTWNRLP